jgi:hypothetical protein
MFKVDLLFRYSGIDYLSRSTSQSEVDDPILDRFPVSRRLPNPRSILLGRVSQVEFLLPRRRPTARRL